MHYKIRHFMSTVTTAATRERLTTLDIKTPKVMLMAERSNTGYVYVGDNQVSATSYGVDLAATDSVVFTAQDLGMASGDILLSEIWLDVSVSTDGVGVTYYERIE